MHISAWIEIRRSHVIACRVAATPHKQTVAALFELQFLLTPGARYAQWLRFEVCVGGHLMQQTFRLLKQQSLHLIVSIFMAWNVKQDHQNYPFQIIQRELRGI